MADITLSPQQVAQAEQQQQGLNSIPENDSPRQSDVVMPAKQLELTPDENNDRTIQEQIQHSSDTSVGFTPKQLNQIKELMNVPGQQQEQPQQPSDPNGLPTIEELDLNNQQAIQPQTQEPTTPTTFEIPDDENAKAFKQSFEKYLGFPLEQLKTYSDQFQQQQQELAQIRQDNYRRSSVQSLSQEWGVNFGEADNRLNAIKERFNQYSPEMQKRLDNLEGAKLIWSRLELERNQKSQIPQFQRSSSMSNVGRANDYMFTEKQLDNMPRDEYERNADRIFQAYAMGLVKPS